MSSITISDEELHSLTHAILRRYGIDFTGYEPTSFKRRVARSISVLQLESVHNLWIKLLREPPFIYAFINEVSVGLTSMFRDPVLWQTLKNDILKTLNHKKPIDIWHAGCSTGEEVYSMGIVLQECGLLSQARALATDISEAALAVAQAGNYHTLKMEEYGKQYLTYHPHGLFQRYYRSEDTEKVMKPELVQHVDFQNHNLLTELPPRRFDIIFCRNVMIYFDHASKVKLLNTFYDHLHDGGYLIIGFYDALVPLMDKTQYQITNLNAKIFQKTPPCPPANP